MEAKELSLLVEKILDDKKAIDVLTIDISTRSSFADCFVIASGGSTRQVGALADDVYDELAKKEILPRHVEGKADSGWILLDYGDTIVNIFGQEERERYNIEKLWGEASQKQIEGEEAALSVE
jgi:ribosome-associated protein